MVSVISTGLCLNRLTRSAHSWLCLSGILNRTDFSLHHEQETEKLLQHVNSVPKNSSTQETRVIENLFVIAVSRRSDVEE